MRVSIITVTFNAVTTLEETIKSVAVQRYKDIEYIIVDGGSQDGTVNVVKKYYREGIISKFVSEPDDGLYDAMNKGLRMASGDIVTFLNADDFYFNENIISDVTKEFADHELEACYGDVLYVARNDTSRVIRHWKTGNISLRRLMCGWQIPHPSLFVVRDLAMETGGFDITYKIAADFEYMLKIVMKTSKIAYLNKPLVIMRWGGTSTSSLSNMIQGNREIHFILKKYGLMKLPFSLFLLLRFSNRFCQLLEGLKWQPKKLSSLA